jgi:hypothetical protein
VSKLILFQTSSVPPLTKKKYHLAFSHLENGKFLKAKIVRRKCPAVMLIFVPVNTSIHQAVVFLRGPHNHPMHPKTKPTSEEKHQLEKAIQAAGRRRLTVQKLLNGASQVTTLLIILH